MTKVANVIMMKIKSDKIRNTYKQYGFLGFIGRLVKASLSILGIRFNRYYYLVNNIDYQCQKETFDKKCNDQIIKVLTYNDFLLGDPEIFNAKKLKTIRYRLEQGDYLAYGIIENNKLIYSCWLSFKELQSSNSIINGLLSDNECLMLDAYCNPRFRGQGLHSMMNAYRLMKGYERGKTKCVAIILHENIPALKSQLKVGYRIAFIYYVLTLWGKSYTNFISKKKDSCSNL